MDRHEAIGNAYHSLGKEATFYDGMITCSTLPGRAMCALVWSMDKEKNTRYLEMAEGYVTGIALNEDDEIIGYKFVSLGKMTDFIKKGDDPTTAYQKACGQYGRVQDAVKIIDPRTDKEIQ